MHIFQRGQQRRNTQQRNNTLHFLCVTMVAAPKRVRDRLCGGYLMEMTVWPPGCGTAHLKLARSRWNRRMTDENETQQRRH